MSRERMGGIKSLQLPSGNRRIPHVFINRNKKG